MRGQKSRTVVLVFLLVCGFFSFLQFPIREARASVSDDWYYTDFAYRVEHNITGSSAGDQTNYQMRIVIVNGSGTSSDDTYYTSHVAQSDFDDVRFTWYNSTSGQEEPCDFWKEEVNSGENATFWVEIPEIPSSGTTTIYVYYGSASATDASNGDGTFLYFFDAEEASELDEWSTYGTTQKCPRSTEQAKHGSYAYKGYYDGCLLYTSPSPRD